MVLSTMTPQLHIPLAFLFALMYILHMLFINHLTFAKAFLNCTVEYGTKPVVEKL